MPFSGDATTVVDVLDQVAEAHPEAEAYVDGEVRLSYGGLASRSAGWADTLAEHGIGRGDVVAIRLPSSVEFAVAYLGALRLGCVATGINPRLGRREVEGIVSQAHPSAAIVADGDPLGGFAGTVFLRSDVAAVSDGDPSRRLVPLSPDDPVAIVWTSGTTGQPKGAVFDHRRLEALSRATGELSRPFDRRLSPVPFAHVGYMTRLWDEIANVMANVIVPTPWSARAALDLIEQERITVGQGVPTQWELMLRQPDLAQRDLSSLRLIATGAARVPAALVAELRHTFRCPVVVRYATTEASVIAGTTAADPPAVIEATVGAPCPTVEVRIADEKGRAAPPGEVGMIEVRSPAMMCGYLGEEVESPIRPDGWLVTGDAGSLDEDGRIHLVGRRSEMYIRGGYNVYPLEVEQVLAEHPCVAEVAVAGVPDVVLGALGVAWVAWVPGGPDPGLDGMRRWCKDHLADYKAPDRLIVVDALPRNQMGKVDKLALLAQNEQPFVADP
jgi:acyl-CoA synthetase (AMP-forming)/AMP-acid ligase II